MYRTDNTEVGEWWTKQTNTGNDNGQIGNEDMIRQH